LTPYYEADGITIWHGDCREIDAWDIADGVMVTDPPYGTANRSNRNGLHGDCSIANDESTATRARTTSVLSYFIHPTFNATRSHPNQKPLALMSALVAKCPPLTTVVDPFMGAGTTLRAAKDHGLAAIGVELEERYCEVAARSLSQGVLDFGAAS
jgi:hypothetical protein